MAIDFRCEKCGKLLSVDAEAGKSVTCPHCHKKMKVPEGLASLPRPHVPPDAKPQAPEAGPKPAAPAARRGEPAMAPEEGESDAVMNSMAKFMPWVISAFFHMGLFLIMAFVVMFVRYSAMPEEVIVPSAVLSENPGGRMDPGEKTPELQSKTARKTEKTSRHDSSTSIQSETTEQVKLTGVAGGAPGSAAAMQVASGSRGAGPRSTFFGSGGNAHHIVYVLDRSGSMAAAGVFDTVKYELVTSIAKLKEIQDFHVILFAEGRPLEAPNRRLVPAIDHHKTQTAEWLGEQRAGRATDPIPALERAFEVLGQANRMPGKLIYLLTDGDFPDNAAVERKLKSLNPGKQVLINTYLYGRGSPVIQRFMDEIAQQNGGMFKHITEDD